VEAFVVFQSPAARWRAAFVDNQGQPIVEFVRTTALVRSSTPLSDPSVLATFAWWGLLLFTAGTGVWAYRRRNIFPYVASLATPAPLVAAYLLRPSFTHARFLIPAYASLVVASGAGVVALFVGAGRPAVRSRRRLVGAGAVLVLFVALVPWQISRAINMRGVYQRAGHAAEVAGTFVRRQAAGRPCRIASQSNEPAVYIASGCRRWEVNWHTHPSWLLTATPPTDNVLRFVVLNGAPPRGSIIDAWPMTRVVIRPGEVRVVFERPRAA
jgi:hypothetical protein